MAIENFEYHYMALDDYRKEFNHVSKSEALSDSQKIQKLRALAYNLRRTSWSMSYQIDAEILARSISANADSLM